MKTQHNYTLFWKVKNEMVIIYCTFLRRRRISNYQSLIYFGQKVCFLICWRKIIDMFGSNLWITKITFLFSKLLEKLFFYVKMTFKSKNKLNIKLIYEWLKVYVKVSLNFRNVIPKFFYNMHKILSSTSDFILNF